MQFIISLFFQIMRLKLFIVERKFYLTYNSPVKAGLFMFPHFIEFLLFN